MAAGRLSIESALSLQQFDSMQESIPKDREIVFFTSSTEDMSAVERAVEYQDRGYTRVSFLEGGILAWDSIAPFLPAKRSASRTPEESSDTPRAPGAPSPRASASRRSAV